MNFTKLSLTCAAIACTTAAQAEITLDAQNNVSYAGAKSSTLSIGADGSASVNGTLIKKCDSGDGKTTRTKLGSVTCEDGFVVLKDKHGNTLNRFSSYALATDAKGNSERKLYDESLAKLGSPTTGATELSQKQVTTVEETKTTTVQKLAPAPGYLDQPKVKAPDVNQTTYTPKLGVMAQKTPSITKENTISDTKNDHAVAKAEKEARTAPAGSTVPMPPITQQPVVIDTQIAPAAVQTQTTTTISTPTPSAAAAGVKAGTTVSTQTQPIAPGTKPTMDISAPDTNSVKAAATVDTTPTPPPTTSNTIEAPPFITDTTTPVTDDKKDEQK